MWNHLSARATGHDQQSGHAPRPSQFFRWRRGSRHTWKVAQHPGSHTHLGWMQSGIFGQTKYRGFDPRSLSTTWPEPRECSWNHDHRPELLGNTKASSTYYKNGRA